MTARAERGWPGLQWRHAGAPEGLMTVANEGPVGERAQAAPRSAFLPAGWSLRTRLALLLALAIAFVIGVTTYLQSRVFERAVEGELSEAARLTALAVADDLELREGPLDAGELTQTLREFVETVPELRSITVVTISGGRAIVFASTASGAANGALETGRQALERRGPAWSGAEAPVRVLAVPFSRGGAPAGAVAVTVSFDSLIRLRNTGRVIAAWSTVLSIVSLFVLVELLTRWFIHRPIDAIRDTVGAVAAGSLEARAPVLRRDEIGAVAAGLNHMLDELQGLHASLQSQVAQATDELRQRNRDLLDLYQQMFRLREELGRSQQLAAVGETTSAVAHQIGTPLNLVSGHIQILLEQEAPGSAVAARLRVAEEQIRKVAAVVQGLLDRSRRRLENEAIDLSLVIGRLCALVQPALETAGVRLSYVGRPVRPIIGDVAQLELALLSLISNALDAMPGGGELRIGVADSGADVRVEIADTGVGIDPALRDRVFEPWFTTKAPGRGTGLGLSITRGVVTEHGGRIDLESEPGRGTTVTVMLPARPPAGEAKPSHA
jgi:signal transduction histidine kinase